MLYETENRWHGFPERAKTGTAVARKSRGERWCSEGAPAMMARKRCPNQRRCDKASRRTLREINGNETRRAPGLVTRKNEARHHAADGGALRERERSEARDPRLAAARFLQARTAVA
jgi:hypothetical protein